mgnify:CR=1 FL=1
MESSPPDVSILGGGSICDNGSTVQINFTYNGLVPWDLEFINESDTFFENNIHFYKIKNIKVKGLSLILTQKKVERIINSLFILLIFNPYFSVQMD